MEEINIPGIKNHPKQGALRYTEVLDIPLNQMGCNNILMVSFTGSRKSSSIKTFKVVLGFFNTARFSMKEHAASQYYWKDTI